ncbi:MAG: tRNA (guanine(6)-N2)-methyltransferase [Candidatus Asgardarchaeia archaeon]
MREEKFLITTTTGLEDVTAEEVKEINGKVTEIARGRINITSDFDFIYRGNYLLRTAHKIIYLLIDKSGVSSLDDVYKAVKQIDIEKVISKNQTFAVKFDRVGTHSFTSIDLARKAGSAIITAFMEAQKSRLKVNLKHPDVLFEGKLIDNRLLFGVNTSGESLHKRRYRVFQHEAPLKPSIAFALVKLSNWTKDIRKTLLDPMCGAGTILIEAALFARNVPAGYFRDDFAFKNHSYYNLEIFEKMREKYNKKIDWNLKAPLFGIEISKKFYEGAIANASSAKVADTITFIQGDALELDKILNEEPEIVIVNPPYGVRLGRRWEVKGLYEKFMKKLAELETIKRVVVMAANKKVEVAGKKYFNLKWKRVILYGHLSTLIYMFEKE